MNQDQLLHFLYCHPLGRLVLKPLVGPPVSHVVGRFMDRPISRLLVPYCIRRWQIPMAEYERTVYRSYNDFFTRQIRREARPFPSDGEAAISPCDGLATAYPIRKFSRLLIKHTCYTLEELFHSARLARQYEGGIAVVIRLTVSNYHRYHYPVSGDKSVNRRIGGKFHTVNPVANELLPVYQENTREYTRISSPRYGNVLQMEVGALCVGRIVNHHGKGPVARGQEKGRFEFGGSTVILFFEKGRLAIRPDILMAAGRGDELPIRMGEALEAPADCSPKKS